MSLDIRRFVPRGHPRSTLVLSFEDDGYYWFLHPLFERLRAESGKYVDLYGGATFTQDDWGRLRRMLDEAKALAEGQPPRWDVHVGTQTHPVVKELYASVSRDEMLGRIATFRRMVEEAERVGGNIECLGD